jgi:hypothetical protein
MRFFLCSEHLFNQEFIHPDALFNLKTPEFPMQVGEEIVPLAKRCMVRLALIVNATDNDEPY